MSSLSTAVISLAVAAGLAGVLAEVPGGEAAHRAPEIPLAALAWAQLHCGATLSPDPGTPRVQYEDFMRVAGGYDAISSESGITVACDRATASAQYVAHVATQRP